MPLARRTFVAAAVSCTGAVLAAADVGWISNTCGSGSSVYGVAGWILWALGLLALVPSTYADLKARRRFVLLACAFTAVVFAASITVVLVAAKASDLCGIEWNI
jgi:hypothetical protein